MSRRALLKPAGYPVPDEQFTPGIRYGDWVFVSGTHAGDYKDGLLPAARGNPAVPLSGEAPFLREARAAVKQVEAVLNAGGTDLRHGVRLDQFPSDRNMMDPYHEIRRELMPVPRPVSASVHVGGLLSPDAHIAVELLAMVPRPGLEREPIVPKDLPKPIQGFTPAIRVGDYVFLAGQVATDFETGIAQEAVVNPNFWEGSKIESEARFTIKNMESALKAAGSSLKNVVKATVYLSDINDIARFDRVWREAFPHNPPARTIYPITSLGIADIRLEITMLAVTDNGGTKKEAISTDRAPKPLFHESQAVRAGDFLFLSGLMACDENGLAAAARANPHNPYAHDGPAVEMRNVLDQASEICRAADTDLRHALRLLTVHTDLKDYGSASRARFPYFPDGQPTFTTFQVPAPLQVPGCTMISELWIATKA